MSRPADDDADGTSDGADVADVADGAARKAERLLRWYPRPWRDRYGAEFTELLMADISERPRSPRRSLDVMRGGILARLADAGLAGFPLPLATAASGAASASTLEQARQRQVSASLGSFSFALGGFLVFGAALWSQILIAWQWSAWLHVDLPARSLPPLVQASGRNAFFAVFTTGAMLVLLALAVLAALPVLAMVVGGLVKDKQMNLIRPAIALAVSLMAAFVGGRHFENNWLGTGGQHALVPSGLAAFEACLGLAACVTMAAFVVCYGVWIADRVRLEPDLPAGISVGATNATVIALLVVAPAVAAQAARMAVRGLRRARA